MSDTQPELVKTAAEQLAKSRDMVEQIQKNALPKLNEGILQLKAVDQVSDEAFKSHVGLRISNLEKLSVLNGATLALSFSGIAALKSATPIVQLQVHSLVSIAWMLFILSIVCGLVSNWAAVMAIKGKHAYRTFNNLGPVLVVLEAGMTELYKAHPELQRTKAPEIDRKARSQSMDKFWRNAERLSELLGGGAQIFTIGGLALLCIFFIKNIL